MISRLLIAVACIMLTIDVVAGQSAATSTSSQALNTAFSADNASLVPDSTGGWREGRATFYDAPAYFQKVCI